MSEQTLLRTIPLDSREEVIRLFGPGDSFLRMVKRAMELDTANVYLVARGESIQVLGSPEQGEIAEQVERVFTQLRKLLRTQDQLSPEDIRSVVEVIQTGGQRVAPTNLAVLDGGRHLRPRTDGQARYVQALRENDVVICAGPAGSGKTFLAVAMAVTLLRQGTVKRLVLVRPAVEAGERLGYLPGDLVQKINPYLRPLVDSLNDLMEPEQVRRYMENDIIEMAPLAYMRGRAQPLTSPVLTPEGFRPIGSIRVGDSVIGSDGEPTLVEGVYPQGEKDVYRVRFTDGASTRCCAEHLWTVYTREDRARDRGPRVLETREMIGRLRCAHYHRYELPLLSRPVEFPWQDVPLDPYALGLLLGDGCLAGKITPRFSTADPELVDAFAECLPLVSVRHVAGVDYALNKMGQSRGPLPNPVTVAARELGLWGSFSSTKFVPERYLFNTPDIRLAVLQGLLDTDGGPVTQDGRTCRVQYTTTSPRLKDDVLFLVRSLGGLATVRVRAALGRKPGMANGRPVGYRNDAYILDIRLPEGVPPFRLSRKARRYQEAGWGRPMRYVQAIETDGREESVCIRVAAHDSLYVTDDFLLTHNTINNAAIILDEGQNATVSQMKMFLTRMGHGSKIIVTGDITQTDLPPNVKSGLQDAVIRLKNIKGIAVVHLDETDIVRNPLVSRIVQAYEDPDRKK